MRSVGTYLSCLNSFHYVFECVFLLLIPLNDLDFVC